ncbi:MAG TPA: AI-2E family transporter [Ktedonobacteraceae bacterium]|nr:AI-2E family transporter [Ktedonobacteraceae bacterium]
MINSNRFHTSRSDREMQNAARWARRRDIPIAVLAWLILGGLILWAAGYIVRSLLVVTVAALLAFALTPAVKLLQRVMPRVLAVIIVYLVVLSGISLLLYAIINTTIGQVASLADTIKTFLTPQGHQQAVPLVEFFARFGITLAQLQDIGKVIENQATGIVSNVVPFLSSVAEFMLNIVIVAVLSIYLLLDGPRAIGWLRRNAPIMQRERTHFFLDTLERVIGGYIRGQLIMSTMVGVFVGVGMTILQVPYGVLLGVIAFILEFVPIIGTILSGVLCVLLALSKGWIIALIVLVYFIVVHVVEGDILAPRIVGRAVGVHPAVSLFALLAGAELFGIWGAVLGSPLAGLIQAVLVTVWQDWRANHPEQFPEAEEELIEEEEDEEEDKAEAVPRKLGLAPEKSAKPGTISDKKKN